MKAIHALGCACFILFCAVSAAAAQTLADPAHRPEIERLFQSAAAAPKLRCEIRAIPPTLNYHLQFQSGYVVTVPLEQFDATPHQLTVYLRVTPEGREPVYLSTSGDVPHPLEAKVDAEQRGSVVLGEGTYAVTALAEDDEGRVCLRQWKAQAKPAGVERELTATIPAGEVRELGAGDTGAPAARARRIERLTVLVHAAPLNPKFSKIEEPTIATIDDSLVALLEQLPAKSVRLVVFSQAKQAVLLRQENFTGARIDEVRHALEQAQLGTVNYGVLVNSGKSDVWSDLAAQEASEPNPATAVILMGPRGATRAAADRDPAQAAAIRWYYLQYNLPGPLMPGARTGRPAERPLPTDAMGPHPPLILAPTTPQPLPPDDALDRMIHRLNGVTFTVRSPHDLAEAIHRMAGEIPTVEGAEPAQSPETHKPDAPRSPALHAPDTDPGIAAQAQLKDPGDDIDPVEALAHLRDRVLDRAATVPNHTCVESVQRDRFEPVAGRVAKSCDDLLAARKRPGDRLRLDLTDWLRLDVGVADSGEVFSWAGAAKFEEGDIDEMITEGAFGTGPFASLLVGLFESQDPHFVLDGETVLNARRALQYSFRITQDESHYRVKAAKEWVITGYTGSLLLEPRTSDLLRLSVRTDELPRSTGECETDATLDYKMTPVGETEYLLPYATRQRFIGADGAEAENSVSFAACREFRGQSSILFGPKPVSALPVDVPAQQSGLPDGLPMAIAMVTPLTFGQAAAGDRIDGKLLEELRDPATKQTLAPAGAAISGRLTRVEWKHGSPGEYTVALRWESLATEERQIPLNLKPDRKLANLKAGAAGVLLRRGQEIELPQRGEERDAIYHFSGERTGVEGGLRTQWITSTGR